MQTAIDTIQGWNFGVMKQYMLNRGIFPASDIDAVEAEYKKYLILCLKAGHERLAISKEIDDFWHTHILFTQDYTDMCHRAFGSYLHHRPNILDSEDALNKSFTEETLQAYRDNFGEPDPKWWGSAICYCSYCKSPLHQAEQMKAAKKKEERYEAGFLGHNDEQRGALVSQPMHMPMY